MVHFSVVARYFFSDFLSIFLFFFKKKFISNAYLIKKKNCQDQTVYAMDVREGKPFALYRGQHGPIRALNVYGNKLCIGTGTIERQIDITL